jgi:hypothetical protein
MCVMRHEAEHKASDVVAFSSLLQRIGQKRAHEQSHTHVIRVGGTADRAILSGATTEFGKIVREDELRWRIAVSL